MKLTRWFITAALLCIALPGFGQGFVALIGETDQALTNSVDGSGAPLADGAKILIYWDQNNNGPDKADVQPEICKHPPMCEDGPAYSVNLNSFTVNGIKTLNEAGKFFSEVGFVSVGGMPENPHYYLVVEGNGLNWHSNTFTLVQGPNEIEIGAWSSAPGIFSAPGQTTELVITEYKLHNNFPNPFNNATTITFDLVEPQFVKLSLFNVLGQNVATLVNETKTAGRHTLNFDATSLSTGIYLVRFEAGSFTALSKMMLLK
jgi:hypothetical protein